MADKSQFYWAVVGNGNPEPVAVTGKPGFRRAYTIGCADPYGIDEVGCPCRLLPDYEEGVTDNAYDGSLVYTDMEPMEPPTNVLDKQTRAKLESAFKAIREPRHGYAGFGRNSDR